jgi:hypothetical protein
MIARRFTIETPLPPDVVRARLRKAIGRRWSGDMTTPFIGQVTGDRFFIVSERYLYGIWPPLGPVWMRVAVIPAMGGGTQLSVTDAGPRWLVAFLALALSSMEWVIAISVAIGLVWTAISLPRDIKHAEAVLRQLMTAP